jgi:hypothetical protein
MVGARHFLNLHPRHLEFVEKNKADFARARLFDS